MSPRARATSLLYACAQMPGGAHCCCNQRATYGNGQGAQRAQRSAHSADPTAVSGAQWPASNSCLLSAAAILLTFERWRPTVPSRPPRPSTQLDRPEWAGACAWYCGIWRQVAVLSARTCTVPSDGRHHSMVVNNAGKRGMDPLSGTAAVVSPTKKQRGAHAPPASRDSVRAALPPPGATRAAPRSPAGGRHAGLREKAPLLPGHIRPSQKRASAGSDGGDVAKRVRCGLRARCMSHPSMAPQRRSAHAGVSAMPCSSAPQGAQRHAGPP